MFLEVIGMFKFFCKEFKDLPKTAKEQKEFDQRECDRVRKRGDAAGASGASGGAGASASFSPGARPSPQKEMKRQLYLMYETLVEILDGNEEDVDPLVNGIKYFYGKCYYVLPEFTLEEYIHHRGRKEELYRCWTGILAQPLSNGMSLETALKSNNRQWSTAESNEIRALLIKLKNCCKQAIYTQAQYMSSLV